MKAIPLQTKLGKNQFRCFHCRLICSSKDGNWYHWNTMEVHLCNHCERLTKDRPERRAHG